MPHDIGHAPMWIVRPGDLVDRRSDQALAAMDFHLTYDQASHLCFFRWLVQTGRYAPPWYCPIDTKG